MAAKKGPKSRKARTGSAALRAYRSTTPESRKAVRAATGRTGKPTRAEKVALGTVTRRARIKAGTNPNTGKGSGVAHSLRRATAKGLITNKQRRKAIATLRGGGPAATSAASVAAGRSGYGGSQAKRGAAIAASTRAVRKSRKAYNRKQKAAGTSSRIGKYSGKKYSKKS